MSNKELEKELLNAVDTKFVKGIPGDNYNTDFLLCTFKDGSQKKFLMKDISKLDLDWSRPVKH